jgi:replicative DNA helicase
MKKLIDVREKMRTSEFKDIKIEKQLIAGLMKYEDITLKCMESLSPDVFSSNRCKWIYEQMVEFFDKNSIILDRHSFSICLDKKVMKERNLLLKMWDSIAKLKKSIKRASCFGFILKLPKLYEARLMEVGISGSIELLTKAVEGGESYIDKASSFYADIAGRLGNKQVFTTITEPCYLFDSFKKNFLKIQKDPESFLGVPTGIEKLDRLMGGLRPSEFGLVTAGTGVGKSILLLDFAFNCFLATGNILYVTIEMPENQLRERFYCRISGIKYDKFRMFTLNDSDWELLQRKIDKLKEHPYKFDILDIPQSCNVRVLRNEIENYIRRNCVPKLIVIDYLNILEGGFEWSKQLELAVELKQKIARYFKIPLWSANQLSGSKHEKEHIKISDMAYAKNIADNVDVGIAIGVTEASDEAGIFNFDFTKTRDFKGTGFMIKADRSRMTFCRSMPKEETTAKGFKKIRQSIGEVIT